MDSKAHGGFVFTDKLGQQILGVGERTADDQFVPSQAKSFAAQPADLIIKDLQAKGVWEKLVVPALNKQDVQAADHTTNEQNASLEK